MRLPSEYPDSPETESGSTKQLDELLHRPLRTETEECRDVLFSSGKAHGVAIGRIVGNAKGTGKDGVLIVVPALGDATLTARVACALPESCVGRECAVLFEDGNPTRPLVMGLLLTATNPAESAVYRREEPEIRVDGERVVIEANQELELRCGESVILLQRDGRIEIRGNYVTSQATATQRIRGGSVHIN